MKVRRTVFSLFCTLSLLLSACNMEKPGTDLSNNQTEPEPSSAEQTVQDDDGQITTGNKNLIVYFSRWGNTEYPDDVDVNSSASIVLDGDSRYGITEYIAQFIQKNAGGDLYLLQTTEPYPTDFDEVVDQNVQEMNDGFLPELKESNLDLSEYDTVFIGYPIWAMTAPRPIFSFLEKYDLYGKTIVPFCTHHGYGAGRSYQNIADAEPDAQVLEGFAIDGDKLENAEEETVQWLKAIGSVSAEPQADKVYTQNENEQIASEKTPEAPEEQTNGAEQNILIAYFSHSGNTEQVAQEIARQTQGTLFELVPEEPYPDDYNETVERFRRERDENARPALASKLETIGSYDLVFVGYPIWGGDVPHIVRTFLEQHNWEGKTIIPFCTHGGSRFGNSLDTLEALCTGAVLKDGYEVSGNCRGKQRGANCCMAQ